MKESEFLCTDSRALLHTKRGVKRDTFVNFVLCHIIQDPVAGGGGIHSETLLVRVHKTPRYTTVHQLQHRKYIHCWG
jgi:hypothetical protein